MTYPKPTHSDDADGVALQLAASALNAIEGVPDRLQVTFLRILAHRHREAADMIEARALALENGGLS